MRYAHSFKLLLAGPRPAPKAFGVNHAARTTGRSSLPLKVLAALFLASTAAAFEGRINAVMIRGSETNALLYTVGTDSLRVEMTATNWPNPVDILDRNSGALTLLFPNNRSFVHVKPATDAATAPTPGPPGMPMPPGGLPPGIGPQPQVSDVRRGSPDPAETLTAGLPVVPNDGDLRSEDVRGRETLAQQPGATVLTPPPMSLPPGAPVMPPMPPRPVMPQMPMPTTAGTPVQLPPGMPTMPNMPALPPGVGPQAQSGMPSAPEMPSMPAMPMPMMPAPMMSGPGMREKMELQATGQKTNLLGFACEEYQLKQRGETLEIWATDQLLPYQPYVQNQPHRFGPQRIEEQWPAMLTSRKLFPLLASLRYDNGAERFRFEVQSVTPQKLTDAEAKLFQPPAGWFEIQPLPF